MFEVSDVMGAWRPITERLPVTAGGNQLADGIGAAGGGDEMDVRPETPKSAPRNKLIVFFSRRENAAGEFVFLYILMRRLYRRSHFKVIEQICSGICFPVHLDAKTI